MLSVDTAQLLQAVSEQRRGLLRYVPELYVSATLDMVSLTLADSTGRAGTGRCRQGAGAGNRALAVQRLLPTSRQVC